HAAMENELGATTLDVDATISGMTVRAGVFTYVMQWRSVRDTMHLRQTQLVFRNPSVVNSKAGLRRVRGLPAHKNIEGMFVDESRWPCAAEVHEGNQPYPFGRKEHHGT